VSQKSGIFGVVLSVSLLTLALFVATSAAADTYWQFPDPGSGASAPPVRLPEAGQSPMPRESLRDDLRARLAQGSVDEAMRALETGDMDAFERHWTSAMENVRDPDMKAQMQATLDSVKSSPPRGAEILTNQASQAEPVQEAVLSPGGGSHAEEAEGRLRPKEFVDCGPPDRHGVSKCYQAPERGLNCQMQLRQGGQTLWSSAMGMCEEPAFLERRNAFFKDWDKNNPPMFGEFEARHQAIARGMTEECARRLMDLVDQGTTRSELAVATYSGLDAYCRDTLASLAAEASIALPIRKTGQRSRALFERALNADPNQTAAAMDAILHGRRLQPEFDLGEVLGFAMAIGNLALGIHNMRSSMRQAPAVTYSPAPAMPQGGLVNPGHPDMSGRRAPQSDISGTR